MRTVATAFLRYLPQRRGLTLLQVLGVGCGVAAVMGMHLSSEAAVRSLTAAVDFLRGGATHTIRRSVGPMSDEHIGPLARDPAVHRVSPVLEGWVRLEDGEAVRVLGVDPFLDRGLRPEFYRGVEGLSPGEFLERFVLADRAVLAEAGLAARLGALPGDRIVTAQGDLTVAALFDNPAGEHMLVMDIAAAQDFFLRTGSIDRADLILSDPEAFRKRWSTGFVVQSAGEQGESLGGMLKAFRLNMQALSLMALFVGVFLVYNTAMFAVVSRRRDAGILRSLGAGRAEVATAFLAEVSLLGLAGGLVGGGLGFALSRGLTGVVGKTVSNLYFSLSPQGAAWSWRYAAAGMLLGWGASLLGAAWPLLEVVRADPVRALHGRVPARSSARRARGAAAAGLAIMAVSLVAAVLPALGVGGGFLSAFGFLAGASLCAGTGVLLVTPPLGAAFGGAAGLAGRLAAGAVRRNLGRTSVAAAAFMVSLALTVGLGTMIGSFRASLQRWMEGQLQGEIYVGSSPEVTIPPGLYEDISALDGVAGVDRYRNEAGVFRGETIRIAAVDGEVLQRHARFWWTEGGEENWDPVRAGAVIVSESFSRRFGIARGDTVELEAREGREELAVAGVFYDYTTEHGLVMMDRSTYRRLFEDHAVDSLGIFLEPGLAGKQTVVTAIAAMAAERGLPSWTRQAFFDRILSVFDSTFALTRSMRAMAIIIALFGISGALITLFMERRKEFGVYRALGFSVGQVAGMSLIEGLIIGLVSFVLCVPSGTVLAILLIGVVNLRSFNWTIFYSFSWEPYLLAGVTAAAAGAAASIYPVWKLWRTYPQLQLREE